MWNVPALAFKGTDQRWLLKRGTCAKIPAPGQRQRHGDEIQSERLCELTGVVCRDEQRGGLVAAALLGWQCQGVSHVPGCGGGGGGRADENYNLSFEIQLRL